MATRFKTGYLVELGDIRDKLYAARRPAAPVKIKKSVDFRPLYERKAPVWDQGNASSCTGHGVAICWQHLQLNRGGTPPEHDPSRLFLYYYGRKRAGLEKQDEGAYIRDVAWASAKYGVALESEWKYSDKPAVVNKRPGSAAVRAAGKRQTLEYFRLNSLESTDRKAIINEVKTCLSEGFPFTFGFTVYNSIFDMNGKAFIPVPKAGERPAGGHCVAVVGYNQVGPLIRNSWGGRWGLGGYAWMEWDHFSDEAMDGWTLRKSE